MKTHNPIENVKLDWHIKHLSTVLANKFIAGNL